MFKVISILLVVTTLLLNYIQHPKQAIAGTCAGRSCPPPPIGFIPGQRVDVQVINFTNSPILLAEKVGGTNVIPIAPGQTLILRRWLATEPNFSLVFWSQIPRILTARVSKTNPDTLRVALISGGEIPGDRTIYIKDDGRVTVF
jgi:hypothetical protein